MVLLLLYQRKAVRLVVVIKKVLVRRTEERTANVVPSFFFFLPVGQVNDCKFRSYYVIFATLQQKDSSMNEFLSYIIINEANFAA